MAGLIRSGCFCRKLSHKWAEQVVRKACRRGSVALVQRRYLATEGGQTESSAATPPKHSVELVVSAKPEIREKFIPITRMSLVRLLMQEEKFMNSDEVKQYEKFAAALDTAILNRYYNLLQELKSLFDPINPDKDTVAVRKWNRRERLDNEFWLLTKLTQVMERANFHELPNHIVQTALDEHEANEGVRVSVNRDKYDVLKFWALGKEQPLESVSWYMKWGRKLLRKPEPKPIEFYKRVVVAVRLKTEDKLLLKCFKEVPVGALEQLLPAGKIQMSAFDKNILAASVSVALAGVVIKVVTVLAHMDVQWTMIMTGLMALMAVRAWTTYKNRHNAYLAQLSRMLYFKNVANNRGLLTLLVDRAQDEIFKEALLSYTFLLTNRPPSAREAQSVDQDPSQLGSIDVFHLERHVREWLEKKTSQKLVFDSAESIALLTELGLLSADLDKQLHVIPLEAALRNLPHPPPSLTPRSLESDLAEGYDSDISTETEEEYKQDWKQKLKIRWF